MKIRLFLLFVFFAAATEAFALNISGQLVRERGTYLISSMDGSKPKIYNIKAGNLHVESILRQLNTFDHISATGTLAKTGNVTLQTIDFVSLRRLLGIWENQSIRVNFLDFNRVTIDFWNVHLNIKAKYNYAVSPGRGNTWRMYFTNMDSVTLGVLTVNGPTAQLEIFDPETGDVAHSYQLQKTFVPQYAN